MEYCQCCGTAEISDFNAWTRSKSPGDFPTGLPSDRVCMTCYIYCNPASPSVLGAGTGSTSICYVRRREARERAAKLSPVNKP